MVTLEIGPWRGKYTLERDCHQRSGRQLGVAPVKKKRKKMNDGTFLVVFEPSHTID